LMPRLHRCRFMTPTLHTQAVVGVSSIMRAGSDAGRLAGLV
jgi:hypothetical protein